MHTMLMKLKSSLYVLLSIFLFSSCNNSSREEASRNAGDTSNFKPGTDRSHMSKAVALRLDTVVISDMKFNPAVIKVRKGDGVIWVNNDMVAHCVTETKSKAWTSSPIPAGGSWQMQVTQSADYYCAIHLVMKGKILVE
jgi:plastocyanin